MRLVFASNNAHKLSEVRAMMPAGVEVLSLHEIGFDQEIDETGRTLAENSRIKADTVAAFISSQPSSIRRQIDGVFADDTGLEIDALGGKPGVYTARWYLMCDNRCTKGDEKFSGSPLHDEMMIFKANRAKALRELAGESNRDCHFKTVITLITNDQACQVEGIVRGRIAEAEYGEGGFGYDPIFIPEGYDKTFGELPAEVKNSISHRAKALTELVKLLKA